MKTRFACACALIMGCTIGGGSDDPTEGIAPVDGLDGGNSSEDDGAVAPRDASTIDATARSDGGGSAGKPDAGTCGPTTDLAVCDPVKNTGCQFAQQCDLDTAGSSQAGRCVLYNPIPSLLGGCSADALSSSCTGGNACINNACAQLCYCDSDCAGGKKCSGTVPGASGPAKLCQ